MKRYVKILGMRYRVRFKPKEHPKLQDCGRLFYGQVFYSANRIYIRDNMTKDRTQQAILHEIIHAIGVELDVKLSEKDIMRLASGLRSSGVSVKLSK